MSTSGTEKLLRKIQIYQKLTLLVKKVFEFRKSVIIWQRSMEFSSQYFPIFVF